MNPALPLVSVAMATYNGEKYLAEQLDSIIGQSHTNLEVVVVDDGSSDGTIALLQRYAERYPFVRFFQNEKNLGITKTFEKAVALCKGDFTALSDQDDVWLKHKIETLVANIGGHDAVYSDSLLVDENGRSLHKRFSSMLKMQTFYSGLPLLLSNVIPGHTVLMKGAFAQRLAPFPENVFYDLWVSFNAAAGNGIKFINEVLVHYRQHTTNAVGTGLSSNKRKRDSAAEQFRSKKAILQALSTASIKDKKTAAVLQEMLRYFHRGWSVKRSAFFFRYFDDLLALKQKPHYRKLLYCLKMFFKPNF